MVQQININSNPLTPGVRNAQLINDPLFPGVTPANFNADPNAPGVMQVNLVDDPLAPNLFYFNDSDDPFAPPPSFQDVQLLGTLIGTGLADTGQGDATNLLMSSQQAFSGVDWGAANATAADTGVTDPLAGATASILTETAATATHYLQSQFVTATVTEVSFSIYLKQGLRTRAALQIVDAVTPGNFVTSTFDLAGGVVGIAAAVGGTFTTPLSTITLSGGFYLCTVSANLVSGSGRYFVFIYGDSGAGAGAASTNYAGNITGAALTLWGAKVNTGVPAAYTVMNANTGAAATTVQQAFTPNGTTTAYWGTQTANAWVGFDFGVPVQLTRYRVVPRASKNAVTLATAEIWPIAPDYATTLNGTVAQTSVSDSAFGTPSTVDTINTYLPRYWMAERTIAPPAAARYFRLLPPSKSYGGISVLQVFAKIGTTANAQPVQPVITPNGGRYPSLTRQITMTSTQGAKIFYTTDGSTPTTSSTQYTGAFNLTIGAGATVIVKAIANLATLSTPNSMVATSAPFYGYGFKANDDMYDTDGNLIEAHAGSIEWDPNTNAYYWIGELQNINSMIFPTFGFTFCIPSGYPATYLYKGVSLDPLDPYGLLNWKNMGNVLPPVPVAGYGVISGRYHLLYNSVNNNYVCWLQPQSTGAVSTLFVASTSGSDITKGWTWNSTQVATNFYDYDLFRDSDGITVYAYWRNGINTDMRFQQLNSTYTGFTGSPLAVPLVSGHREGCTMLKYPFIAGGVYFTLASQDVPFDSSLEADVRYIWNIGATPLVNTWSPLNGGPAFAVDPIGTNYNGQGTHVIIPKGKVQPVAMLDFWKYAPNYASRYVFAPINISGEGLAIQIPATWDLSTLASGYTLSALNISANVFSASSPQGTNIGAVQGMFPGSSLALIDTHSGAVQMAGNVIQVGPTPPGASTFNITVQETLAGGLNSPRNTTFAITEIAAGGYMTVSAATFTTIQNINLTTLGWVDWAAFGHTTPSSIERKSTGGSLITAMVQVGAVAIGNYNNSAGNPVWACSWTDGSPTGAMTGEGWESSVIGTTGTGFSFTVPAGTSIRVLTVYIGLGFNGTAFCRARFVASLSDASAGPLTDLTVTKTSVPNLMAAYTVTYAAASAGQTLTITITNDSANAQNVELYAVTLQP